VVKNKHIGLRLGLAFIVLIAILAGVGQLGLRRMHEINDTFSDITGRRSEKLQLAREALALSNNNNRITMEIFLVQDRALISKLLAARLENTRKISELMAEIAGRCESEKEEQELSAVTQARKPYVESYQRALHLLIDENAQDAAARVMVDETLPTLLKYHAAWDEFVDFQKVQLDLASEQAQRDYAKARRLTSSLVLVAVIIAVLIAVLATRVTAREIAARVAAKNEVTKLNASLEDRVTQRTRELSEANKHLNLRSAALEAAANAIVITDSRGTIMWVNHAFTTMTGYSKEESLGMNSRLLKSGDQPDAYYASLWSTILSGKVWQGQLVNRRKDGTTYTEEMTITPVTQDPESATFAHFIAIKQDITERMRAQNAVAESEKRYRSLFENMLEGFAYCQMIFDDRGRPLDFVYLDVNGAFGKLTGLRNVVGRRFSEVVPRGKRSQPELLEKYSRVALTGEPARFETEIDGLGMWFSISAYAAENGCFIATFDNITERKQAEEALRQAEEKYRVIFEDAVVAIFQSTPDGRYTTANPAMARMLGYDSPQELVASITDISQQVYVDPKSREEFKRLLSEHGTVSAFECQIYRKDGSKMWIAASARTVFKAGVLVGYDGMNEDITARKVAEERVQYLAYYDALTELPNRTLLHDRLSKAMASARRQKDKVALLFLDLDRFKNINDSLGHALGDLLLQKVAERLKRWAREQDTVARLGGDEFLLVLTRIRDVADAAVAAERLMAVMTHEFIVDGNPLSISCSLGVSIFPEHGESAESLIKNADAAMYSAKEKGRNNFRFFTEKMNTEVGERLTLENSLRMALERNELFLVYQPQMDMGTGKIVGLEALLRWQHPELGLVPPDRFIRIAENSGLIMPIGEWVLRTACSQARKWQDEGHPPVSVAVNVSAVQFRQEDFCNLIRRVLHETGLAPQYLELELTESLLLTNADVTFSVLQELKAMGLTLAIDDFGTGYSSFSYLRQFRVSKLKIDRSFVRDVAVNPDDAAITSGIIGMAKSLNLKVIAEGVENEAQMSFLRAHQCDEIQGYYFSKPLTVDKVADKLRSNDSDPKFRAQASAGKS
jgi:diguanylate cyclase (GGDEF)-like protein/PAS domain S-box-containing protein